MPINKVLASTLAGAVVTLVAYLLKQFADVELTTEATGALIVLVSFFVAYFVPISGDEVMPVVEE